MIIIARMRGWLGAVTLGVLLTQAGCDKERTLSCAGSIDQACAVPGSCVLTWAEAEGATSFCADRTHFAPLRIDCGQYHIVTVSLTDASRTYYYDVTSGMLAAIVTADAQQATTTCDAGPTTFTPPICSGVGSQDLLQCFDGGVGIGGGDAAIN
jgi:hypothetical protein